MSLSNLPPGCPSDDGMTPDQRDWETLIERIADTDLTAGEGAARWDSQPELLEACKELLACDELASRNGCPEPRADAANEKARAAIATAKGGA